MTTSLPTRELYVLDIPDVENFNTKFVYNFFVENEAIDDTMGTISRFKNVINDVKSESDTKILSSKVPRWVEISFKPVKLSSENNDPLITSLIKNYQSDTSLSRKSSGFKQLIADNISKIMTEEEFSSFYYVSMDFRDSKMNEKIHSFVSGTLLYQSLINSSLSTTQVLNPRFETTAGTLMSTLEQTPKSIDSGFVSKVLFFQVENANNGITRAQDKRVKSTVSDITKVTTTTQINSKFVASMLERAIKDPFCTYDADMFKTYESAKTVQDSARQNLKSNIISSEDFKTRIKTTNTFASTVAGSSSKQHVVVIGYLIDKMEVLQDGKLSLSDQIIVDNPNTSFFIDTHVKYYAEYIYVVRTLALVTMPTVVEEMNDLVNAQFIIASRPTVSTVSCIENVPPPPASDIKFVWNYEFDKLIITWSFPPNSQRDIKKFQIYRRSSINEPFQLLKMYDFDNSTVKATPIEEVSGDLTEKNEQPKTFFEDNEFLKTSKFIYAICCVDAHGISSDYSSQFEISFDMSKNKLKTKLISHANSPKEYPNMFLDTDAFVDTMNVGQSAEKPSGPHSRLTTYFTPQCYNVMFGGTKTPIVMTKQMGAKYRLTLLNLDNQRQQIVDLFVDDQTQKKI